MCYGDLAAPMSELVSVSVGVPGIGAFFRRARS
jgi:hypothetical protein